MSREEPPRARASPLRRALRWLFAGRDRIDQEGLLAERTLLISPRRAHREDDAPADAEADERRSAGDRPR